MKQGDADYYKVGEIKCTGGCIEIYKATFGCKPNDTQSESLPPPNPEHLEIARAACEGREECGLYACGTQFGLSDESTGEVGCEPNERALWVVYG